jgi:hypothetical protein
MSQTQGTDESGAACVTRTRDPITHDEVCDVKDGPHLAERDHTSRIGLRHSHCREPSKVKRPAALSPPLSRTKPYLGALRD